MPIPFTIGDVINQQKQSGAMSGADASKFFNVSTGRGKPLHHLTPSTRRPSMVNAKTPRGWTVTYYDQLTPGVQMIEIGIDENARVASQYTNDAIADSIRKIYDSGGKPTWAPNGQTWKEFKSKRGYDTRVMHMSGDLEMNVHNLRHTLHSRYDPKTHMFTLDGLEAAFYGTEYVWPHELVGAPYSGIRRPFIYQGIMEGLQATILVNDMMNKTVEKLAEKVPPIKVSISPMAPLTSEYAMHKARLHMGLLSLLMWVLPPSKVWAIYGGAMDVASVASGQLLEARYLSLWVTAYLKGMLAAKAGFIASEKQGRRLIRRKMWGRR